MYDFYHMKQIFLNNKHTIDYNSNVKLVWVMSYNYNNKSKSYIDPALNTYANFQIDISFPPDTRHLTIFSSIGI